MHILRAIVFSSLLLTAASAAADPPRVLRFATVAPDGTAWARELRNFARHIEEASHEQLKIKLYLNAIAGDEREELARLQSGMIDGVASTQIVCEHAAPTMRIARLPSVFQDRDESKEITSRLEPEFEQEAHQHGLALLTSTAVGAEVIFTRTPVHNMAELRKLRLWRWDLDEVGNAASREMGLNIVPLPLTDGARAFDEGRIDGFMILPTAALAFQFATRARYLTDLRANYLWGCIVFSERSFQSLPAEQQAVLREASAVERERMNEIGRHDDEQLLKAGLLRTQGVVPVPVSESFRSEFFAAARAARDRVADRFVPRELLDRVLRMLVDYRAEHEHP